MSAQNPASPAAAASIPSSDSLLRLPVPEDPALTARWNAWIAHNRVGDGRARLQMRMLGLALGLGVAINLAMAMMGGAR